MNWFACWKPHQQKGLFCGYSETNLLYLATVKKKLAIVLTINYITKWEDITLIIM